MIGDDLTVTNKKKVERAVKEDCIGGKIMTGGPGSDRRNIPDPAPTPTPIPGREEEEAKKKVRARKGGRQSTILAGSMMRAHQNNSILKVRTGD